MNLTVEDVRDRIRMGAYTSTLSYPKTVSKPKFTGGGAAEAREFAERMAEWESSRSAHDESRRAYREDEARLMHQFRKDVREALDIEDHPKAGRLLDMAWEHGHSSGLESVLFWADELSELIS